MIFHTASLSHRISSDLATDVILSDIATCFNLGLAMAHREAHPPVFLSHLAQTLVRDWTGLNRNRIAHWVAHMIAYWHLDICFLFDDRATDRPLGGPAARQAEKKYIFQKYNMIQTRGKASMLFVSSSTFFSPSIPLGDLQGWNEWKKRERSILNRRK